MPTEILMPALSPTMEEGTLAKWHVKEGDSVSSGDIMAEIETDKATMEFEAIDEGIIGKIMVAEGTEGVKVNAVIAILLEEGEASSDIGTVSEEVMPKTAKSEEVPSQRLGEITPSLVPLVNNKTRIFSSPLARRIAANTGLDIASIKGSGPQGRVVKTDVEAAQAVSISVEPTTNAPVPVTVLQEGQTTDKVIKTYANRPYKEVKLDGMRKIIASRLTEAKQTVPHFYLRREIHLDTLLKFRSQLNTQLEPRGIKLSINDFIIKACALALQQVPEANAVWAGDRTLQFEKSDVAVAVAIEGGLFTPVLQDADSKSLSYLSKEMKDLAIRARERNLAQHEYTGGSLAISNLGMFGIENFDAIINPPHSAILAVGAGTKKPVVDASGQLAVSTVMSTTLSVDHRVIDGALGSVLLNAIKTNLENPIIMLA